MKLLALETSCDETSAAVLTKRSNQIVLYSNIVASSLPLHAKTGGVIPEVAARKQIEYMLPVIKQALRQAASSFEDIDAIAVTVGPGLIGSLLVGVETAKTLSFVYKKPLIPVNHLLGHIYVNWIEKQADEISLPALGLIVSGGHTDLFLIDQKHKIQWIGGTRDDAAGEAFDKIGRLIGFPYPAGAAIEKAAQKGKKDIFSFPRPLIHSVDFDFSFSGLKTAVFREVQRIKNLDQQMINNICLETQTAIIDVLIKKTLQAAEKYQVKSILLGGGVAANGTLTDQLRKKIDQQLPKVSFFVPARSLCTDNAAMIGATAYFHKQTVGWKNVNANPQLYFS